MKELPRQFNFREDEERIYKLWEKSGFFRPETDQSGAGSRKNRKPYCNVLPPPNANGELHLGHASGYAVMDIFGRYERMQGKKVLLLPGKDHAGIQTQVVFEKKIKDEKKGTREELGREKFFEECFDFVKDRASFMRAQEKKIGLSADWSREKFTLDPDVSKIALETFVQMFEDGMVYRGKRIINWCPRCSTALSDLEVLHKKADSRLYYIKYPVKNSPEFITVATTRPETMLGDMAVAVNPDDSRYFQLIGRHVILPLINRELPIITDRRIDKEFGTGAVKITPAHDLLDWEIGKDHKLEAVQVIDEQAQITINGGRYRGQDVLRAREHILSDLKKINLLEKEEFIANNLSLCERCATAIEPLISNQWFVAVDAKKYSLKKEALNAIRKNEIRIYPHNFRKILIHWFENLEDWCISRQIWWGHRFPVWYRSGKVSVGLEKPAGEGWNQDKDTFDTWFSSGQWAYSTLGYPQGKDYKNFYPTDMMVMGRDILFFWSARMIMMSLYRTGHVPFKNLYFTGLIRDKKGRKMSKSRGNGIDPLKMIEKYGADALRLSLVMDIAAGQDSRLYEEKIAGFRNFVTKLWNIARYAKQSDLKFKLAEKISKKELKTLADRWIISELEQTKNRVAELMENRDISLAQARLRRFTWDQMADWYLEIHKLEKNSKVLGYILHNLLKLWHPFAPFVTEEIWKLMAQKSLLIGERWPKIEKNLINNDSVKEFEDLQNLIAKIRNLRSVYRIDPAKKMEARGKMDGNEIIFEKLARLKFTNEKNGKMLKVASHKKFVHLNIAKSIDIKKESRNLEKEIQNLQALTAKTETLIKNEGFISKAGADVIEAANARLHEYREKLKIQKNLLQELRDLT